MGFCETVLAECPAQGPGPFSPFAKENIPEQQWGLFTSFIEL
jgi:hypothetical protein